MESRTSPLRNSELCFQTFRTEIGWCGLLGLGETILSVSIGCASSAEARQRLVAKFEENEEIRPKERNWFPRCQFALERYASGERVDLDQFQVDLTLLTPFQQQVLHAVRTIPCGTTQTYGEIAAQCGSPRAARAVGGALARNPVPLLIPCHRVVGTNGRLTGFTAPRGLVLKEQLLTIEQQASLQSA